MPLILVPLFAHFPFPPKCGSFEPFNLNSEYLYATRIVSASLYAPKNQYQKSPNGKKIQDDVHKSVAFLEAIIHIIKIELCKYLRYNCTWKIIDGSITDF